MLRDDHVSLKDNHISVANSNKWAHGCEHSSLRCTPYVIHSPTVAKGMSGFTTHTFVVNSHPCVGTLLGTILAWVLCLGTINTTHEIPQ